MRMPSDSFPKGWPVRCPNCESMFTFVYVSDRTGNVRRYRCRKCGDVFLATWKGKPLTSCMHEPRNTKMGDWDWARVIPEHELAQMVDRLLAVAGEATAVEVPEMDDGTPACRHHVRLLGEGLAQLLPAASVAEVAT
jgi:hypothetical protein